MELEIKDGKFWILENKADENNIQRFIYDDERSAMSRVKQLLKTIDAERLFLSTIDIGKEKEWKITNVAWAIIAMGIVRDEITETT